MHSIRISKPKKNTRLTLSLYIWSKPFVSPLVSLSLFSKPAFLSLYLLLHCSSTSTSTGCRQNKKKENKKPHRTLLRGNSQLTLMGCGSFSPNAKQDVFLPKLGHHLRLPTRQQWRVGHYPLIAAWGESTFPFFLARWNSRIFLLHKIKCSTIGVLDFLIICFSLIPFDNHVDLFDYYS